jgi:Mg-chelatase subunit ChlI
MLVILLVCVILKALTIGQKDKAEGGTRPPFNAIAKLLVQGATVETLFGVEYNKIHGFGGKIKITNEDISNAMLVAAELLRNQKNENSPASENNESVDDVNDSIENG